MKPRITLITIGVDDLERSLRFYRDGLGFETQGIVGQEFEHGAVVFFDLSCGLKLALFSRKNIAHDAGVALQPPSATEFTLAHNVSSEAEVDVAMEQAAQAGSQQAAFERGLDKLRQSQVKGAQDGGLVACGCQREA